MAFMQWSPDMSVGLSELDEDHRFLIKIINDLSDAAAMEKKTQKREVLRQSLRGLQRYAEFHFAREEAVMRACGYDSLARHQAEHRRFTDKMAAISQRFDDAKVDSGGGALAQVDAELLVYLKDWLTHHIMVVDMGYKPLLRDNEKAAAAARDFKASETWWQR